jgi:hypothetical protein
MSEHRHDIPQLKSLNHTDSFNDEVNGSVLTERSQLVAPACAICLSQNTSNLCAISCGHVFHHACVLAWFRSSKQTPKCPTCKKLVTSNSDIIKLYYSIEENDGSYFPTPRVNNKSNSVATQKTFSEYGTQTEANKNNSESNLKLQLQVERSRCGQMQQKIMNISRTETKYIQKVDELKMALNVARERLKDVGECSDREKWLREQLANSERNAEDRYDVIHKQYLEEKKKTEENATENLNLKKMIEMINSDLVLKSRETLMLKKNNKEFQKKNSEINKTIKIMDQAYARLKMTNVRIHIPESKFEQVSFLTHLFLLILCTTQDHLKTELDKNINEKEIIGARESALKDAMEHMFTKRNEREKLTREYKRLLTIRKNRIKVSDSSSNYNNNIPPSPIRAPPPSAERLKQLLESDVSDRAEAVLVNGPRLSKSNSQPPQWFARAGNRGSR